MILGILCSELPQPSVDPTTGINAKAQRGKGPDVPQEKMGPMIDPYDPPGIWDGSFGFRPVLAPAP